MCDTAFDKGICSRVIPTDTDPPQFFFEIWKDWGDGCRGAIKISASYPTKEAATEALNAAIPTYLASND